MIAGRTEEQAIPTNARSEVLEKVMLNFRFTLVIIRENFLVSQIIDWLALLGLLKFYLQILQVVAWLESHDEEREEMTEEDRRFFEVSHSYYILDI